MIVIPSGSGNQAGGGTLVVKDTRPASATERIQRRIERLLDQIEEAMERLDWESVRDHAQALLRLDPDNIDALTYLAAANREPVDSSPTVAQSNAPTSATTAPAQPTSFANDRYQVKRFLGEGGKKRVYLAQDTLLDREVAFALIKTEGLDETSRTRIQREAQAMGRLGSHPHIVTVFDLGEEQDQPYVVTELMGGVDQHFPIVGNLAPTPQLAH